MKRKLIVITLAVALVLLAALTLSSCAEITLTRNDESAMIEAVDALNEGNAGRYVLVSFPGLNIPPMVIDSIAFSIGSVTVYWYGILLMAAIVLAFVYAFFMFRRAGVKTDDMLDSAIFGIIGGVIGGRIFYVLTSLEKYSQKPFWEVFAVWDGGLAIMGALMGGALAIFIVCKVKKISALKILDVAAPAAMLGQIVGRWGNFLNGESYGYELREGSPLYFIRMGLYPHASSEIAASKYQFAEVNPAFLYESLWNLIGFVIINVICLKKKKKYDGLALYLYMIWYGFGRTFIELVRVDSLYMFGTIRASAFFAVLAVFAGAALIIWGGIRGKKIRLAGEAYESAFPMFRTEASKADEAAASASEEPKENNETGETENTENTENKKESEKNDENN